jgi:hypothetical protein
LPKANPDKHISFQTAIAPLPRARLCSKRPNRQLENRVPSLIRFLFIVGVLAGLVYGGMIALVTFVEPQPREMIQGIPPARLNK